MHHLEVHGRLSITRAEHAVTVTCNGRHVTINCEDTATLKAVLAEGYKLRHMKLGPAGAKPRPPHDAAERAGGPSRSAEKVPPPNPLERLGLDIEVQLKGTTIARLGEQAEPGWLEKKLGLKGLDVKPGALIRAWFK